MSIQKFPADPVSRAQFIPVGQSGSYSTPTLLRPGVYKVTTDTSQNIAASNFYLQSADGIRFTTPIKGGVSYVSLPVSSQSVFVNSGAFPLPIELELTRYTQLSAPSATVTDYSPASLSFVVPLPQDANSFAVFWQDGTQSIVSGSTGSVAIPLSLIPYSASSLKVAVAARDTASVPGEANVYTIANAFPAIVNPVSISTNYFNTASVLLTASYTNPGVVNGFEVRWSDATTASITGTSGSVLVPAGIRTFLGTINASVRTLGINNQYTSTASYSFGTYPWIELTSSSTITVPGSFTGADLYLLGGGAGGGNINQPGPQGVTLGYGSGGGGAGRLLTTTNTPVSGSIVVVIGAGGSSGAAGGNTTAAGQTSQGGSTGPTANGSVMGTAGGNAGNGTPTGGSGSYSPTNSGAGGGGGGVGANGTNATSGKVAGAGGAGLTSVFSTPVGGGGGGGSGSNQPGASLGGASDGGAPGQLVTSGVGGLPPSADTNRGGGGGGAGAVLSTGVSHNGGSGGSGRAAIRLR